MASTEGSSDHLDKKVTERLLLYLHTNVPPLLTPLFLESNLVAREMNWLGPRKLQSRDCYEIPMAFVNNSKTCRSLCLSNYQMLLITP